MDEVLRLFQDATGAMYDGDMYGIGDLDQNRGEVRPTDDDGESDLDENVVFHDESEEESDDEEGDPNWTGVTPGRNVELLKFPTYMDASNRGPVNPLPQTASAFEFFSLFFPEETFEMIVRETNLYAAQQQELKGKPDKYWKEVTVADIKIYMAINIMMGIHVLPEYNMYWSKDDRLRVNGIADVMGKNRYEKITQYLHLNDSSQFIPRGEEGHDPLFKVRPIVEQFRERAADLYIPGPNLSIDEAMIAYTGRLYFKQYIRAKPTPWGIKVWCIADPTNGYMLDINVYTGRINTPMPNGVGHHVVMKIGEKYLHKFHHFFYDNYFASIPLAENLLARRTYSCSTIRAGRKGWPQALVEKNTKKMAAGEVRMMKKGPLLATLWNDKRKVSVLSTNSAPAVDIVSRRMKGGRQDTPIPRSVLNYNSNMFGVDLADQLRSYYGVGRSGVKWWRYVFWFVVQLSLVNAWNLFKASQRPHPSNARTVGHLRFRLDVCTGLVAGNVTKGKRKVQLNVTSAGSGSTLSSDHQLERLVGRKAACVWCAKSGGKTAKGRTSETVFGCTICKCRLHKGLCFASFHQELAKSQ